MFDKILTEMDKKKMGNVVLLVERLNKKEIVVCVCVCDGMHRHIIIIQDFLFLSCFLDFQKKMFYREKEKLVPNNIWGEYIYIYVYIYIYAVYSQHCILYITVQTLEAY